MLSLSRTLLSLKSDSLEYHSYPGPPQTWVYGSGSMTVAGNFSSEIQAIQIPVGAKVLSSRTGTFEEAAGRIGLEPWEAIVQLPP